MQPGQYAKHQLRNVFYRYAETDVFFFLFVGRLGFLHGRVQHQLQRKRHRQPELRYLRYRHPVPVQKLQLRKLGQLGQLGKLHRGV